MKNLTTLKQTERTAITFSVPFLATADDLTVDGTVSLPAGELLPRETIVEAIGKQVPLMGRLGSLAQEGRRLAQLFSDDPDLGKDLEAIMVDEDLREHLLDEVEAMAEAVGEGDGADILPFKRRRCKDEVGEYNG